MTSMPQIVNTTFTQALLPWPKPFLSGSTAANGFSIVSGKRVSGGNLPTKNGDLHHIRTRRRDDRAGRIKASYQPTAAKDTWVTVSVTVTPDSVDRSLWLELVPAELDVNGDEKTPLRAYARQGIVNSDAMEYEADFHIPGDFGEVGAIRVENADDAELFIDRIVLNGFVPISFSCHSWVAPYDKRIFFTNKSYLPSETPNGLKRHRGKELELVRGDGTGTRQFHDRIYDYDVYNDLGYPDVSDDLARPVLGGNKKYPYPRRCRTGRPKTEKDKFSESRTASSIPYVPRDEAFSATRSSEFKGIQTFSAAHQVLLNHPEGFPFFTAIDSLYNEFTNIPHHDGDDVVRDNIRKILKTLLDNDQFVQFNTPEMVDRDKFAWMRDEEFSRQTLAGINPCSIQLVKEWPLKSKLDPHIYGPPDSAITKEFIEQQIKGFMTFDEALKRKKLFMLDYHDILLPYVEKVRKLKGTTLYGSRAVFFLTPDNTLMPVGIELTQPPMDGNPEQKRVYRPCWTATGAWLWKLARAHLLAHDSGIHQLVSHWLRTHCCTEPYIIAANRQLSEMHPIYRLLRPHFRYTMEINAFGREKLISAGGAIEQTFSPLKYSMELSSDAYDQLWRFDHQALPADLISRGMAEPDPNAPHGLKLAIEDYPFANDGLILWDILKEWVTSYVTHYYKGTKSVESDAELQAWWTEIRTVGHGDKKHESWWPVLTTHDDLIATLTTIIWVTSGLHAAVNFGQYDFAGYFPNRPTIARTTMPTESHQDSENWDSFMEKPENDLLSCFPSEGQATTVMMVLNLLSTHFSDEEYLGDRTETAWEVDPIIKAAFEQFRESLEKLGETIDTKNGDKTLRNRNGAGVIPYQLLKPSSSSGVTSQGIPYSISI